MYGSPDAPRVEVPKVKITKYKRNYEKKLREEITRRNYEKKLREEITRRNYEKKLR
jgi:hypothetical protein